MRCALTLITTTLLYGLPVTSLNASADIAANKKWLARLAAKRRNSVGTGTTWASFTVHEEKEGPPQDASEVLP